APRAGDNARARAPADRHPRHRRPGREHPQPLCAHGGAARLARRVRDRAPVPPTASAGAAAQRQPPLGARRDPRRRGRLASGQEPLSCL
ncbi:MAG: hypothetical protein AVDCRST_MAG53-2844, partial [uncultured Solirubrobacteraceae bacterium]